MRIVKTLLLCFLVQSSYAGSFDVNENMEWTAIDEPHNIFVQYVVDSAIELENFLGNELPDDIKINANSKITIFNLDLNKDGYEDKLFTINRKNARSGLEILWFTFYSSENQKQNGWLESTVKGKSAKYDFLNTFELNVHDIKAGDYLVNGKTKHGFFTFGSYSPGHAGLLFTYFVKHEAGYVPESDFVAVNQINSNYDDVQNTSVRLNMWNEEPKYFRSEESDKYQAYLDSLKLITPEVKTEDIFLEPLFIKKKSNVEPVVKKVNTAATIKKDLAVESPGDSKKSQGKKENKNIKPERSNLIIIMLLLALLLTSIFIYRKKRNEN